MLQAPYCENRIVDSAVIQSLSASPSFFASTSILIIGGLLAALAALGATDKASERVRELPFAARMVGAAPEAPHFDSDTQREAFAERAGRVMGLAAETFNDGLHAYCLCFAALAWFISAWGVMAATAMVLGVLYRRECHAEVLVALREGLVP